MPSHSVSPDALATNTTVFPAFASKAAFFTAWKEALETDNKGLQYEHMNRLSNTDVSGWEDPQGRHDA